MSDAVAPTPSRSIVRSWTTPLVRDLPKLSALTLASAIGGGGGTGSGGSTVFALLLVTGLLFCAGACSDERPLAGGPGEGAPVASQLVSCTVTRATLAMECSSPRSGPGTVTIGGQGTVVALRSAGVALTVGADTVLSANVTVQNLSAGPIGTLDGTTPSVNGIRVFFVAPPVASPSGSVDVKNETGTATFTAGGQEYFEYPGMLATQATSAPMAWEFRFHGTATSFTFSVLLSTDVPAAGAVARWAAEPGFGAINWQAVRGWGGDGLALFGGSGQILVREGGVWKQRYDVLGQSLTSAVSAGGFTGDSLYYEVSSPDHLFRRWDGIGWRSIQAEAGAPSIALVEGMVSAPPGLLFAFGFGLWRHTGAGWSAIALPGTVNHVGAAMVLNGGLLITAYNGEVWFRDSGGSWSQVGTGGSGQTRTPYLLLASDLNNIWVFDRGFPFTDVRHWNGVAWDTPALPNSMSNGYFPQNGAVLSSTNAYLAVMDGAGFGYLWHWDGANWSQVRNVSGRGFNDIWARNAGEIYLAGSQGWVEVGDGAGNWTPVIQPETGIIHSIAAVHNAAVWVGTSAGEILKFDGTSWNTVATPVGDVQSMWAWSDAEVWATRNSPEVWHYNGASWNAENVPGMSTVFAVGGSEPGNIWAVGHWGEVAHFNGTSWSMSVDQGDELSLTDLAAVWAADVNFAVTVGSGGEIGMWNGSAWSLWPSPPTGNYLRSVSGTGHSDVWAVGDGGAVVHWDGTNWTLVGVGTGQDLKGVWAASPTEVYVVGNSGTVLLYNGSTWSQAAVQALNAGQNYFAVEGKANGRVYIGGTRLLRGTR